MAFRSHRFLGFLTVLNSITTRYHPLFPLSSFISFSPFTETLDDLSDNSLNPPKSSNNNINTEIDERFALQELSDLFSISESKNTNCDRYSAKDRTSIYHPVLENSIILPAELESTSNYNRFIGNSVEIGGDDHISNYHGFEGNSIMLRDEDLTSSYHQLMENSIEIRVDDGVSHSRQFKENPIQIRAADDFLSPDEKLRGIFLQKLPGAALESALMATCVDLTLEIFNNVVSRGNLGGEAMVSFFLWAIKQPKLPKNLQTYHIILKALSRRKFFSYMEEILYKMIGEGINLNAETLTIVVDGFVRARQVSKAIQVFGRLEEFGLKCDSKALNVLLECLCRRSHVTTANTFFNLMKGKIPFDINTYNVIIGGWAKLGRVSEIDKNWKSIIAVGLSPDCLTFSYLIEGLGRAGRVNDAIGVFDQMAENGCAPETVIYNAMICNFVSVGNLDECLKYYKGMVGKNCEPDIHTYTKLISAFIKIRRVADALEIFDEMLSKGVYPNTGAITSFIKPLCSFGPPHAAMMIYKKAMKKGSRISLKAYKLLIMRLSRFGKCGMVLKVWEEMQESGYSTDMEVYEYVINGLCNNGQLENAVLVMEEALRNGFCPSKVIYSKLNNKLLNVGKVERAYKLLLRVKEARCSENAQRFWRANGWHF